MKKKEFTKHLDKIQKFMGLDNWIIQCNLTEIDSSDLAEGQKVNGEIVDINYTYFRANINFDFSLLEDTDDEIIHVIFHEYSHIYTSNTLQGFEDDREHYEYYIGKATYVSFVNKYNTTNEQQTELLARRFKELYLKTK